MSFKEPGAYPSKKNRPKKRTARKEQRKKMDKKDVFDWGGPGKVEKKINLDFT